MPSSSARCTHASAASSSTCEPWVSQLPYEMAEIFRPLAPRLRVSMRSTLARGRAAATGASEPRADRAAGDRPEVVDRLHEDAEPLQRLERRDGAVRIHALVELQPHERRADRAGQAA